MKKHTKQTDVAVDDRALCSIPVPKPVVLPPGLNPVRERAIRVAAKKWVNGTQLHYCFIDRASGPKKWAWIDSQKDVVRWAVEQWKSVGIGLSFVEVTDASEAEIVIGCYPRDGSWSLVGTDNLDTSYRDLGRTLNYGWDLTTDWGNATALHELGHALGLSHEHQSPKAGIVWNEDKVYEYFSGPPNNWNKETIDHNIISKLDPTAVEGSNWDPKSIMEYPFRPGLIKSPKPYDTQGIGENLRLSAEDKVWVRSWYPPLAKASPVGVMDLQSVGAVAGQQKDFVFKPSETREYTVSTVGRSDARVVLFENRDGSPRHLASDDDSGTDSNVQIKVKLVQGREYIIRIRVNFVAPPGNCGLLIL